MYGGFAHAGAVVDGDRLAGGHEHRRAPRDPALDRSLIPPTGQQTVENTGVDDAAEHVLRARERSPLDQQHVAAGAGEHERGAAPGRPGPDDDNIDVHVVTGSCTTAPRSSSSTAPASQTTARSASCIIGQCGSTFTLMMRSGWPRPLVCCTAPVMPKGDVEMGVDDYAGRADLALVLDPARGR